MRNITAKPITLRTARAVGVVFCQPATIALIQNNHLPKGNLFDVAKAAGFLGAKNTQHLLPHCHPVSIDHMDIHFSFIDKNIHSDVLDASALQKTGIVILAEAQSIGRTGIEMEVLTGISVAALEIYDMLKPVDKSLEISSIKLLEKKGGKSDRDKFKQNTPVCAVLVCSDSVSSGEKEDLSGKIMKAKLESSGASVSEYLVLPDHKSEIQKQVLKWVAEDIHFIFITGGSGLSPTDYTVEALEEIIEKEAYGIAEAMRSYGQMRNPLAMMSRSVSGSIHQTLIISSPGSPKGVEESLDAILPAVFHARLILTGGGH